MDAKTAVQLKFADEAFDNPKKAKAMNLIDRLQNPSDAEAKAQIDALNVQISNHDEVVAELQAKVDAVSSDLEAAATELLEIKSAKETAEAKANEFEAKSVDLEAQVAELEAKSEVTAEAVAAKAAELLANQGHPAPVSVEDDGAGAKSHLEIFESLTGSEATAYYKAHGKEIRAEVRTRQ
jgi:chromosome segregation ATPase